MNVRQLAINRQFIISAFALLVLIAFFWGIRTSNAPLEVPQVVVPDLAARRAAGKDPVIIDVRGPISWAEGHIDSARHIPLDDLESRAKDLPVDKMQPVVVYCGNGSNLGPLGTAKLQSMGFTNVANLSGGIEAWRAAGHKVVVGKG